MSLPRPSGLKAPSKIGKPSGMSIPRPSGTGIPTPGSVHKVQSAIAKSARAAGISAGHAEKYAADVVQTLKGPELPNPPPPADDFIIGDRVWVSGTKPGFIAFLGETQFAAGEWAGIVLDKQEGKNDGAVQGVRYFQCEPKRGVFARISKLSRTPGVMPSTNPRPEDATSESGGNSVKAAPNGSLMRPTTPKLGLTASRGPLGSGSSLNKAPASSQLVVGAKPASAGKPVLKIGDRVLVSGTKMGTLKYVGSADFAKGEWAGVELDEKQGKNDGAVAGKRYFECRPMYGLFAPVHKVTRLTSGAGTGSTTPSPQARSLMNTSLRLSRERSGSQESVSSISSTASSVSRSRLPLRRIQKTSPSPAKTSQRPSTLNLSATTAALQKALKEKEEHIEQLLRERDLERAEVARAAAHVDEAEGQLTSMRVENERLREDTDDTVIKMKALIQQLEKEKSDLAGKLEDEKRKVEDLQFQIEEEAITKDDLESKTEEEEARLKELEKNHKREKERADKMEQDLFGLKALLKDKNERLESSEDQNLVYLDQIEELTHKLSQAENKVKGYESTRLEEGAKTSQVSIELEEKVSKVTELEDTLLSRNREVKDLQNKLRELNEELKTSTLRRQKMQETIDNLSAQLANSGEASNSLNTEIQKLKTQISDLQRRLDSSKGLEQQLSDEKNQLELQMSDLMRNSGDSSKRLSLLNDQLTERNRKIQELQTDLSNSTQKLGSLHDELAQLKFEKEREKEILINKHEESKNTLRNQIEDMQRVLDRADNKMKTMSEDFDRDKEEAVKRKLGEINSLKKQLEQSREELDKQEVQTQAHRQVLDTITMEKDALQFEKDKAEKHVKRLEAEKETLSGDLIHAKVEVSKIESNYNKLVTEKDNLTEQLNDLKAENEKVLKSKKELQKQKDTAVAEKDAVVSERESLQREVIEGKVTLQQKDMQLEELQKEIDKLRMESSQHEETISQLSQQETTTGTLQSELEETKATVSQLQSSLKDMEAEKDSMKAQLEFSNLVAEERKRLEDQNTQLTKDMESIQTRFSKELEKQEAAKTSLQTELDNSSKLLLQKEDEIDTCQKQIANLKNENSSLEVYRSSAMTLEGEKEELKDKVRNLELAVKEAKAATVEARNAAANAKVNSVDVTGDALTARLQEEKAAVEGQVDFLNSVIVDLQKKNQDLQIRLEAMESGVVTNGNSDTSMEAASPKGKAPPRLFCDICDVFDEHDTDDCPLQAMDYDEPPPSQHHGDRKHMRAYCDICEEFHEPCVLPDDVIDDPIQPIKVEITEVEDAHQSPYHFNPDISSKGYTQKQEYSHDNVDTDSLNHSSPVQKQNDSPCLFEHDHILEVDARDQSSNISVSEASQQNMDEMQSSDNGGYLLKPEDSETQYISDEDLIENDDLLKGIHEDYEASLLGSENVPMPDLQKQPCLSDAAQSLSDTEEHVEYNTDDSVDEFLALEQMSKDDPNTNEFPTNIGSNNGLDEYMQAMQDLSQNEPIPPSPQRIYETTGDEEDKDDTGSNLHQPESIERPNVDEGKDIEITHGEVEPDELDTSAEDPLSTSDAEFQSVRGSVSTEGPNECVTNEDITSDEDSKAEEGRRLSSVFDSDVLSGEVGVETVGPSESSAKADTKFDSVNDKNEDGLVLPDQTNTLPLQNNDFYNEGEKNDDVRCNKTEDNFQSSVDKKNEDGVENETQEASDAPSDLTGILPTEKDEKCKIS